MSPPDGPDPGAIRSASELLGHTMRRLHKHISSQVMSSMQDELQDLDLSFSQMTALHHLRAAAPTTVTVLSEHIHLSVPAASHMLERLVQRDLVTRAENPDNRREKLVALTEAGRGVLEQMDTAFVTAYVTTFARLRPETVHAAQQHLQGLLEELELTPSAPQETA
ncbi:MULTISPECIES: MarR family winged helix-turn-helix transcriptional regulator [Deinococcus]|uniref:MarR family winged helix-turn-helix transcriptional regulator n=1 Tax=Deinococcus rufus TaxID=2136097 RepID=A0ABV7ZF85_9DEIO|nr:MarR family transcriptional regulator [Deinococcus sp. AB2017081]WQE93808.1 MarR family transcriptional regulator [Deinococcus sp. AB2017081]